MTYHDYNYFIYYSDIERCPYATFSTSNSEERRLGREWGILDSRRMKNLGLARYADWLSIVKYYGD